MSALDTGKYYIYKEHVRFVVSAKLHENWANFSVGTKFAEIYTFVLRSSISSTILIISVFDLQ